MKFLQYETRRYFVFVMRVAFGSWLLYAGLMKWFVIKPQVFVGMITTMFDTTWSPHALNVALAWLIMTAEPVLALWILSGKRARLAWTLTAALMFLLVLGQSLLMKPDVIANWQFTVLTLVCAAWSTPEQA